MPISNPVYSLQGQSGGTTAIDTVTDPLQIVGADLSIKDASTVQKGAVQLVSDISDTTSIDKAPTVSYIKELINNSLINPNNLANVNYATLTNIALTGGVTYLGQVIPTNSRVLVAGQTDATTNGIYLSNDGGVWTRTTDADTIEKLYLSQTISLNATKGLYLCTIPKDAVLGVSAITFIQLYQTNDDTIGVRLYQPSTIYNLNDLVVNPSVDEFIFKCLVNGTNNIPPSMASANWEIYQGLLYQNSAIVAPNGDDDKSEGFPYVTYTGAMVDMSIDAYIEGRAVTNTETITPKQGMKLSGKNVQVNNLIVNVNDVKCDGIIFANTIGTAAGMSVTGATNSQLINCSVSNGANAYAINVGGTWDGIHKFLNLNVTGDIQVVGTTTTGVVYFENINNALTLTLNCTNAKVYISNCPNITIVNTLSGSVTVDGVLNPIANDIVTIDANLQQKDSGKKFSIDGAFAANSDNNIPTEKAVKTLVSKIPNSPICELSPIAIANLPSGGNIGTAVTTVDINSSFVVTQTTAGQTVTLPNPTVTTGSRLVTVLNSSSSTTRFKMYNNTLNIGFASSFVWSGTGWNSVIAEARANDFISLTKVGGNYTTLSTIPTTSVTNERILWNNILNQQNINSYITFDAANGVFTLAAGRFYEVICNSAPIYGTEYASFFHTIRDTAGVDYAKGYRKIISTSTDQLGTTLTAIIKCITSKIVFIYNPGGWASALYTPTDNRVFLTIKDLGAI